MRPSSNVIYSVHHLPGDTSSLAVGGIDGVLRFLNQRTGEILASYVIVNNGDATPALGKKSKEIMQFKATSLPNDAQIDGIPRRQRPSITCLAMGMRKVVSMHGDKFIRVWRFQ